MSKHESIESIIISAIDAVVAFSDAAKVSAEADALATKRRGERDKALNYAGERLAAVKAATPKEERERVRSSISAKMKERGVTRQTVSDAFKRAKWPSKVAAAKAKAARGAGKGTRFTVSDEIKNALLAAIEPFGLSDDDRKKTFGWMSRKA